MKLLPWKRAALPPAETGADSTDSRSATAEMDLFDHLRELRKRILWALAAVACGAGVACFFTSELFRFLSLPFEVAFPGAQMIGTGPADAFILKLQLAIAGGAILSSPAVFHQFWLFVAPGLHDNERKLAAPFILCATLLFLGGVAFCHELVMPLAFTFFREQFESIDVEPNIKVGEYLSLILQADLAFGAVFEMPLVAFFLGKLGLIDHHTLIKGVRHAIVLIFIVAAVLTPPDVLTQILMAGPLLLLYGLSILVVKYTAVPRLAEDSPSSGENSGT